MSLQDWLQTRTPAAPLELAARIQSLAAPFAGQPAEKASLCLAAAERGLIHLLAQGAGARGSALDLLAIDALVTYAFEAASSDPERIPELAHEAMGRLSAAAGAE